MSRALRAAVLLLCGACASGPGGSVPRPLAPLPAPPAVRGPLELRIVYPPVDPIALRIARAGSTVALRADSSYRIQARDSAFLFGLVGRGDASLTVNGMPVPVYPTGGWIAWLALPADSVARFELVATHGSDTARLVLFAPIARGFVPPDSGVWVDTTSFAPIGDRWLRPGEGLPLSVRAVPATAVRLRVGDEAVALLPDTTPADLSWGERAFATTPPRARPGRADRYVGWWVGPLGPDPGPIMRPVPPPDAADSAWAVLEVVLEGDTARVPWPLRVGVVEPRVPQLVVVNDDTAGTGQTDSILAGRPSPYGTYNWFFPTGTIALVSGRWNDQVRLQLSRNTVAWVDARDVQPLPPGVPPLAGTARSLRLTAGEASVVLRVPLPGRIPFRVDEADDAIALTLYGIAADMDWIQYGETDPLVRLIAFAQPEEDVTVVTVSLSGWVWGYRTRWVGNDLLLEIRRPPRIHSRRPLAGRLVLLDPGHPPLGATGPTGVREPEVVLAVAQKAAALLEARGARALLTRHSDSSVSLAERTRAAEQADADVLVSIHANALPDGVNPFVNNGTSVYYFHPRSAPLARALQQALVRQFGVRDLGFGRGDLALARPTWMPAALVEGLFIMMPDQEAMLASEEGQWRYARGIVEGLAEFLRERVGWERR